jgi:hypothetical protein
VDGVGVVFHDQGWPAVSPGVLLPPLGVEELRRLLADVLPDIFEHPSHPAHACAYFLAAVAARPGFGPWSMEVHNLDRFRTSDPHAPESADAGVAREYEAELAREYERVMAEVRGWRPPLVLVNMSPVPAGADPPRSATRAGDVLWRWEALGAQGRR